MKRKIVLFTALAGFLSFTLSSYHDGMQGAYVRGAAGLIPMPLAGILTANANIAAINNCNGVLPGGSSGCHGVADPSLAVSMVMFSNPPANTSIVASNSFVPGHKYTIRLMGVYTGSASLTKFGYQTTITGWNVATPSTVGAAGTVVVGETVPLSADTVYQNAHITEQTATATHMITGGTNPKSYEADIVWIAPTDTTAYDSVMIRNLMCAVDGNALETNDVQNAGTPMTLHRSVVGVAEVFKNSSFSIYPNPVKDMLNLQITNLPKGDYGLHIFDISGQMVAAENINAKGGNHAQSINVSSLRPGLYSVRVTSGALDSRVLQIVKQ